MNSLRQFAKSYASPEVWDVGRSSWFALKNLASWPFVNLHPWRQESIRRLSKLHNVHSGERAFILGNGPSLNKIDIGRLQNEKTFGLNRVFLAFPEWGFSTSYFVCVNALVIQQSAEEIQALQMPKFLSWRSRKYLRLDAYTIFLNSTYQGPVFAKDARRRLWEGATVTYVALQLAFFMGFDPVILVGVDHNFETKGIPNTTVASSGEDKDHFDSRYFADGFRWQLPDLGISERAYTMAGNEFQAAGRKVLDATVGGKLEIFPKVDFNSLF
ncbi:MAG: 6-hydroxymethylpterin diphosphokinase MptE-like protein [Anaerolineales bacterium]